MSVTCPTHLNLLDLITLNNTWCWPQVMKLLIMQSSPASSTFFLLGIHKTYPNNIVSFHSGGVSPARLSTASNMCYVLPVSFHPVASLICCASPVRLHPIASHVCCISRVRRYPIASHVCYASPVRLSPIVLHVYCDSPVRLYCF